MGGLGSTELLILLAVFVLLFGARKLPELARGTGQALRILRDETRSEEPDALETVDQPAGTSRPASPVAQSTGASGLGASGSPV
ncbi:twin-arginine translocase TatA/TatE family subunit [Nocardioides campestrisoli]|uniref:twin-arginine translocase TatA/TatE family subunit n=1 Tax=Nocardioides campestrisoli TaxID=2736757 RepID=UPI001C629419|nr:twin-arginine translocase TatA/TatE family subunit [Nocardioides campestrisoli]